MEIVSFLFLALIVLVVVLLLLKRPGNPDQNSTVHPSNDYAHLYGATEPPSCEGGIPEQVRPPVTPASYTPQSVPAQPQKPPAPKKPFSPIPLLLTAGVIFLFLGGIIFLTSTWDMLPDAARAIALLSASGIAFGINILAERILKLPKTGLAFYILGCIFLPLALGGIGAFSLFGEWFSFKGDGAALLMAVIFFSAAATSFLGQKNYRNPFLAWLTLTSLSGMGTSLAFFLSDMLGFDAAAADPSHGALTIGIVQTVMTLGFTIAGEYYLSHREPDSTPLVKVVTPFLFQQNLLTLFLLLFVGSDAPIGACILSLIVSVLCLNQRFIRRSVHGGIILLFCGIIASLNSLCLSPVMEHAEDLEMFFFIGGGALLVMLTIGSIRKLRTETQKTASLLGYLCCVPVLGAAFFCMITECEHTGACVLFLFVPLFFAIIHFGELQKNPTAKDTPHFLLMTMLLFCFAVISFTQEIPLLRILMLFCAVLLLVQSYFSRRLWAVALSICTCISLPLAALPHPFMWLMWLCTIAMIAGLVYAHLASRPVLERACAMTGIPFLMISLCQTLLLVMGSTESWIVTMAALALCYLAEAVLFWKHGRTRDTAPFCLNLSLFIGLVIVIGVIADSLSIGWFVLFALVMFIFAAGNLRRRVNVAALPAMIYLYLTINEMIGSMTSLDLSENTIIGLQVGCCVLTLVVFALMGRFLLPEGFYTHTDGRTQVDFALIIAAFPLFSAASAIDWYPSIVSCLLLAVYSLFYLGRTKNRFIPKLLACAFGCLTLFFHNVHDPFALFEAWHNADFKSPQILLYLLPMHLFLLSMVWILPQKYRNSVHMGRFIMYCITMFCILTASLSFGRAEDGIILAVFSFLIMAGSFFVKRLRWFTLGFSVLFLMTVKLTWDFWRSLHWGIYLFLAGAVLIGIAFYYEYAVRRGGDASKPQIPEQPQNPEDAEQAKTPAAPKEKIRLFKEWNW